MKVRDHKLFEDGGARVMFRPTPNKSGKLTGGAPKFIVIHFTAGGSTVSSVNHLCNPAAKASAHLVIGRDGETFQLGLFDEKLWHAGASSWRGIDGLNGHSVGIELANWGGLEGARGAWRSWTGTPVPDDLVVEAAHRHAPDRLRGWEIYPQAQVDRCAEVTAALAEAYGLGADAVIGHDDIAPGRKTDPGPAWHMERFRGRVFGRDSDDAATPPRFAVASPSGLNLRAGPSTGHAVLRLLPDGTEVSTVDAEGLWRLVAVIEDGREDQTGWVHGRWLRPM